MWKNHPEEYFAMRADWADKNPKATKALLKGIMEAQQWLDNLPTAKKRLEFSVDVIISIFQSKFL
jgi:bicarbonate transport system substrate-binding protein